jgi:hypothetical protein
VGQQVEPRDCTDERWATALDSVSVTGNWGECECALKQSVLRVYDRQKRLARIDSTTVSTFVTPEGMFQLGHSKEHRPDLPQRTIAMAVLDPLGWPLTTTVVAGTTADDPRSLPESAKVRPLVAITGLSYVGDCKRAALGARAEIVAPGDFSLCPLSAKQRPEAELDVGLESVFTDAQPLADVRLAHADDHPDAPAAPVAVALYLQSSKAVRSRPGSGNTGRSAASSCVRWRSLPARKSACGGVSPALSPRSMHWTNASQAKSACLMPPLPAPPLKRSSPNIASPDWCKET